jgi:general secretion pathway protein G
MKRTRAYARLAADQRGMTLIEIMVVIAIIGILSTAIGFGVTNWLAQSKDAVAKMTLDKVSQGLDAFYTFESEYPNSLEDLTTGKNPLLKDKDLKDPWKSELIYRYPGNDGEYDLCSKGSDKRENTDDDICKD